jgi:hypothetical protein
VFATYHPDSCRSELETGVEVSDSAGSVRGVSVEAAKLALFDTSVTRVALPMPLLLIPPTVMAGSVTPFGFWSNLACSLQASL